MPTEIRGATPAYVQIAGHYRRRIASGDLPPGELLRPMPQEQAEWLRHGAPVSQSTIERAWKLLKEEGLIRGVPGVGTEVCAQKAVSPSTGDRVAAHAATGSAMRPGEESEILDVQEELGAPDDIAEMLGIRPGELIAMRRRLVRRDGVPQHISTSYYLPFVTTAAPELLEYVTTGGSRELAAERLDRRQARCRYWFDARNVDADEARLLDAPEGAAALLMYRVVLLDDERVLEAAVKVSYGVRSRRYEEVFPVSS